MSQGQAKADVLREIEDELHSEKPLMLKGPDKGSKRNKTESDEDEDDEEWKASGSDEEVPCVVPHAL